MQRSRVSSPSALEVSVPPQTRLEDIHDLAAFGGGDALGGHGVFGEVAEAGDHVLRLVFDVGEHFGHAVAFELAVFDLAVFDVDRDDVGIAEEVVQIAEGFLVGTDEEDAEHVFVAFFDLGIVQRQAAADAIGEGKFVDLAVAIAGDVGV